MRNVVRAIQMADIGLQPSVDGDIIRIVVPPLTEERRRDIVKMVTRRAEEAKVGDQKCTARCAGPYPQYGTRRRGVTGLGAQGAG